MGEEMTQMLAEYEKTREANREKITKVFSDVGVHYKEKGVADLDLHQGHDIHAFYRLCKDLSKVIHVQGYPGLSSDEKTHIWARLMDHDRMIAIRAGDERSIGNEHDATIQNFENFGFSGTDIPYDAKVLEERLAENVPELK